MSSVTSRKLARRGRPPIGKVAMSNTERQRRLRAKLARKATRKKETAAARQSIRAEYEARAIKGGTAKRSTLAESGEKFAVIYADPPWPYEVYSGKGKEKSADRHYDTATIAAIPRSSTSR